MKAETAKALHQLAVAAARSQGYQGDGTDLVISVCNRKEEVPCKHNFKRNYIEENDRLRLLKVCKKCGFTKEVNGTNCQIGE